jgi:hypothetical protein
MAECPAGPGGEINEELAAMDMQSPTMQVIHSIMMWLHQQGICPMPMGMPMHM